MKIVWFSHTGDSIGGAELSMREAIAGLTKRGVEASVVMPRRGELAQQLESLGATVEITPFEWWISNNPTVSSRQSAKRQYLNLTYLPSLIRLLRRVKPDLVVTNSLASPAGAFAARWARIPHVWYLHEMFGNAGHGWLFDLGERISLKLIDRLSSSVIVNSKVTRETYSRYIDPEKLKLVYYGVEVPPLKLNHHPSAKGLRLILVGSLIVGKRPQDAVRALGMLAAKGLDVRLKLVGFNETAHGTEVRKLVDELGIQDRVEFVGFSTDPFAHVAASDLAIVCSQGEAFGRVTVEAMKLGRPVIGADSAGTRELIQHGTTGLLFDLGNAEDLAMKIETLYHDRTQLDTLGRAAEEWARRTFSLERYADALMEVFRDAACDLEITADDPLTYTN